MTRAQATTNHEAYLYLDRAPLPALLPGDLGDPVGRYRSAMTSRYSDSTRVVPSVARL